MASSRSRRVCDHSKLPSEQCTSRRRSTTWSIPICPALTASRHQSAPWTPLFLQSTRKFPLSRSHPYAVRSALICRSFLARISIAVLSILTLPSLLKIQTCVVYSLTSTFVPKSIYDFYDKNKVFRLEFAHLQLSIMCQPSFHIFVHYMSSEVKYATFPSSIVVGTSKSIISSR